MPGRSTTGRRGRFSRAILIPLSLTTLHALKYNPLLLSRRLRGGPVAEKRTAQKIITGLGLLVFAAVLAVPALDHRFGWSRVPVGLVIAGDFLIVLWSCVNFFVFRENSFSASTVEIAYQQRVVSTGPYAYVRHPMYGAALLLFFGAPLALGSYYGLMISPLAIPIMVWRLLNEETLLATSLPGYREYTASVRWRLIPGLY